MRILLYHEVVAEEPQEVHAVSVDQFTEQMAWLHRAGYQVVGLGDWLSARAGIGPVLPRKAVAITFDDGYLDSYTNALPILLEHGFQATVFLVTRLMGQSSKWREGQLALAPMLTWEQVVEMAGQGIHFGSHTATHPDLTRLDDRSVLEELCRSREQIEQALGRPATTLAYPSNRFTRQTKMLAQQSGYQAACACPTGYVGQAGADSFELRRITILASDTLDDFIGKVRGTLRRRLGWYKRVLSGWRRSVLVGWRS